MNSCAECSNCIFTALQLCHLESKRGSGATNWLDSRANSLLLPPSHPFEAVGVIVIKLTVQTCQLFATLVVFCNPG